MSTTTKIPTRRVSFDLSPAIAAELDEMQRITGLKLIELFRHALVLLRIYVHAKTQGKQMIIVDPDAPEDKARIEMPIVVRPEHENLPSRPDPSDE